MMDADQIETEVLAAFKGLVAASTALDANRYLDCIDKEKFTGLSAAGKAWHRFEDLESVISTGFQMVERITRLDFFKVKVTVIHPATAILVNEYEQTLLLKNGETVQQAGGGAQVWAKSAHGWKLVSISASDARQRDAAVF